MLRGDWRVVKWSLLSGLIVGLIGATFMWRQAGSYNYQIEIEGFRYHCNEYLLEDNKLVLSDCFLGWDETIYNPINFTIEEN